MKALMGPYHDFWVFAESERIPNDYQPLLGRKDSPLRLEDDFLYGVNNLFQNLTTEIPEGDSRRKFYILRMDSFQGLNYQGPTVLRGESVRLLAQETRRLYERYEAEDTQLSLPTFSYSEDPYDVITTVTIPRHLVLPRLKRLAELAEQASEPGVYLLHLGI
jgi:hypothetical protein